jgi:(p)ppGpp synthase/HD superfamily hydrolase
MDLQRAIEFVVRCHSGQTRKGKRNGIALPYVTHCFEVFKVLWQCGACDDITGPAALGHDLIEECPDLDPSLIRQHLGNRAAVVIQELTFLPDSSLSIPTSEQKAAYLTGIKRKSVEAVVIKLS